MSNGYVRKTESQMIIDSFNRSQVEQLFVEKVNAEEFLVTNLDHMSMYKVDVQSGHVCNCDCPHHFYRGVICKHMVKVSNEEQIPLNF